MSTVRRASITLCRSASVDRGGLAVGAPLVSWFLLEVLGGRADLEAAALGSRAREEYTDLLLWGPAGSTPTPGVRSAHR